MRSMAIKVNVSQLDCEKIDNFLENAGYKRQLKKYHCTFGFIEKMIPEEETVTFGQKITQLLQDYIDPLQPFYEVEKVAHVFEHVIAFLPTAKSLTQLKEINSWLSEKVKEVSEGRWELNEETQPQAYIPHLTLWRTRRLDDRFKKLEEVAATHPAYHLSQAAYVLFN